MTTLTDILQSRRSSEVGALLKGSDIPEGITTITIEIEEARQAPEGFNSPVIIGLKKPIYGKTAWAVNITNLKLLIKLFGETLEALSGRKVRLVIVMVQNPKTGETVRSLAIGPKQLGR